MIWDSNHSKRFEFIKFDSFNKFIDSGEIKVQKPKDYDGLIKIAFYITKSKVSDKIPREDNMYINSGDLKEVPHAQPFESLFRSENGELVTTAQVTDEYKSIADKNDIPYSGGHSLRHTFITNCCNAGVPLQALAKWVGHSDIAFMLKTYYDLLEEQEEIEIEKAQNYINNI